MPESNLAETSDNAAEAYDPTFDGYAKLYLFLDFLFLCLLEVDVISGMWFMHPASYDTYAKCSVPIFVLLPFLMALATVMAVRKLFRNGQIQPTAAGRVGHIIGVLALTSYLAMQELARVAFR